MHKRILSHGLDATALQLGASNLLSADVPENNLNVQIPSTATRVILENNGVTPQLVTAIQTAGTKANGGYLLPRLPNYPVIDSAYVPPVGAPPAQPLSLQMKVGDSKPLSADKAASVMVNLGATFVVVKVTVPSYSGGLRRKWCALIRGIDSIWGTSQRCNLVILPSLCPKFVTDISRHFPYISAFRVNNRGNEEDICRHFQPFSAPLILLGGGHNVLS